MEWTGLLKITIALDETTCEFFHASYRNDSVRVPETAARSTNSCASKRRLRYRSSNFPAVSAGRYYMVERVGSFSNISWWIVLGGRRCARECYTTVKAHANRHLASGSQT
jgi:hypothetical protein